MYIKRDMTCILLFVVFQKLERGSVGFCELASGYLSGEKAVEDSWFSLFEFSQQSLDFSWREVASITSIDPICMTNDRTATQSHERWRNNILNSPQGELKDSMPYLTNVTRS